MEEVKRGRVWQIVFYPESCPENFEEIIYNWHIPACLSPLHNPLNNKKGLGETEGKEHYHLNVYFDGNKSYDQVFLLAEQLNTKRIIRVENARAMTRYLIHLDDPDKEQFQLESIRAFSGVTYLDYLLHSSNEIEIMNSLERFIFKHQITNFAILVAMLRSSDEHELLNYVRFKSSYYAKSLLEGLVVTKKEKINIYEYLNLDLEEDLIIDI